MHILTAASGWVLIPSRNQNVVQATGLWANKVSALFERRLNARTMLVRFGVGLVMPARPK
ncbi:hypothetical protein SD81_004445 [Tolypothrix campylonemoides VB511288]|nr:hypothetical protein SD81_004445 [Tolypothrix campylonemoides VB511288]